ncbi:non-ribosomal peptide synthetase/type I polyketide synthase [Dictyobacter arantiisoli]|uniref:Phenolphthiocerol/phthiocerol polyketide synthase subunit E n=1 Tax=Dictyobacter arantiisoli TaxID=2014874 RepID=A0A5A5TG54_9CHLR|nr:non-ribosomal peptide synthetase/type I polyketide synthase [Dictyobacter arantiisoli]GCF10053.1 hypothetical protein KDI_36170 [Dictyobacter arantiisoli]
MMNRDTADQLYNIAVVGMACRFPGAHDVDAFWNNLREGRESITNFSAEDLKAAGMDPAVLHNPHYIGAEALLEEADCFDADFFGYTPREAALIDPQHRIFLECAWEALENAGYNSEPYDGSIAVYAGSNLNSYLLFHLLPNDRLLKSMGDFQTKIASDKDFLATRVSYKLNLKGPSLTIQTACSTSLVAVHQACQSLLHHECDMALAGGVSIGVPSRRGYVYREGMIFSPDGHCRAFDAQAQGTVVGEGAGIVVLKRLADALADGDYIHAVIKGSAINNDGAVKVGYTAPGVQGQAQVIAEALDMSGVEAESITYIEAHGTGTPMGDPVEIAALTQAFRTQTDANGFCAIGSVKTNIGHLDAAAGVAGLIKTIQALKHKELPPSLHYTQPNPSIDFAHSPFYVNAKLSAWNPSSFPRRAGVSSFGIGGTNAHIILEEAPTFEATSSSRPWQLLLLSAKTQKALKGVATNLAMYVQHHAEIPLADIAYTLQVGRKTFDHCSLLVCKNHDEAVTALEQIDTEHGLNPVKHIQDRPVVFLFPGQGAQYVNMTRELYQHENVFREYIDQCSTLLIPHLGTDIRTILYPDPDQTEMAEEQLRQTFFTQPVLFSLEYALAQLWMDWGVQPRAMIGHSIGEYVAACLAGVFTLEDALALVAIRSRMMQALPGGAMLAASLSEDDIQPYLGQDLSLAAVNGQTQSVVSGSAQAVDELHHRLVAQGITSHRLRTSHAFHSAMTEVIVEPFARHVERFPRQRPRIPYISNLTGTWITAEEAIDPVYWARHLRQPVRFAQGIHELLKEPEQVFLEIGPGRTLSHLVREYGDHQAEQVILTSLPSSQEKLAESVSLLKAVGQLWQAGVQIDWERFHGSQRYRVPLPTYPFERQRHWVDAPAPGYENKQAYGSSLQKSEVEEWFYVPIWQQSLPLQIAQTRPDRLWHWLVFVDDYGWGAQLVDRLRASNQSVITVVMRDRLAQLDESTYCIDPGQPNDYHTLLGELSVHQVIPEIIVHCWSITPANRQPLNIDAFQAAQNQGFYSLLWFMQAISQQNITTPLEITVIANGIQNVMGDEQLSPEKATIIGSCKVFQQEYRNVRCRNIDIVLPEKGTVQARTLLDQLIKELFVPLSEVVAYRGKQRWVQSFTRLPSIETSRDARLRKDGVYLITGGLGYIGLTLARYLAQRTQTKLILVGRSQLPPEEDWEQWLETHQAQDSYSRKIQAIRALRNTGVHVVHYSADVGNLEQMQEVVRLTLEQFGALHGVIHAAGPDKNTAFRYVRDTDWHQYDLLVQAKVRGTYVLGQVLQGIPLDFCIVLSSLASVLGGLGLLSYTAVNTFMDAFVLHQNQTQKAVWMSLNLDNWEPEDAKTLSVPVGSDVHSLALTVAEGMSVFDRVLHLGHIDQIIVSTGDLQARIDQWITFKSRDERDRSSQNASFALSEEPVQVQTRADAPRNELEEGVVRIWQEVLGIKRIGIYDNFFELGGHSLLATEMVFRIRTDFQADVALRSLSETPTIAGMAAAIAEHKSAHQPESLAQYAKIVPDPDMRYLPFPLTDMQQAYWIGRSGTFDLGNVSIHLYVEIESLTLDLGHFNQVWQHLIERHDMLRAIVLSDGQQQILRHVPFYHIKSIDLRGHPAQVVESELAAIRAHLSHQVLPLEMWPPFTIHAIQLDNQRIRLCMSIDGLFADGRSYYILFQQLVQLYWNPDLVLAPLTLSFRDYVLTMSEFQHSAIYQRSLDYWRGRLVSLPPAPQLPLNTRPDSLAQSHFIRKSLRLDAQTWQRLKTRAGQMGLTPTALFLAAYAEILTYWSKEPAFTINVPRFNRLPLHPEVNDILGEFASFTLLEVDNSQRESFAVRSQRLQKQLWQDLEHGYVSGVRVLRELARHQGTSGITMPVVFTSFLNLNSATEDNHLPFDKLGEVVYAIAQTPQVWLDCVVEEEAGTLVCRWDAVEELFPAGLIDDMFENYGCLLHNLATVEVSWHEVSKQLPFPEQIIRRAAHNATEANYSIDRCLHTLFEMQAIHSPDSVAVSFEETALTYEELDQRANQLAHYLQDQGVGPDTHVGVFLERSVHMIIALLGVLKAGGTYVPLDPSYPQERIAFILEDAQVVAILTQEYLLSKLPQQSATAICLSAIASKMNTYPAAHLYVSISPENLAYVIYTSGSTGRPKGAMNTHAGVCNRLLWMQDAYQLTSSDRVLQKTPFSFDVSVWEFFWPLLTGACLVIAKPEGHRDNAYLRMLITEQSITTLHFVPSMLQAFLNEPLRSSCQSVRRVISSGEALSADIQKQFFACLNAELHNLYGPTEAAIDVTYWMCQCDSQTANVPIGKPIANMQVYLLDRHMDPVPTWVPGELYIGGVGLARGYQNLPGLTAEKFIPDPFSTKPGARLYQTGDLARYLPDGSIEYLGRIDHQVKIRGFRIEPGEIEAVLQEHAALQDVVVVTREDATGSPQLIAYVVPQEGQVPTFDELSTTVRAYLPEYMLPSMFMILDALPLTSNGKVDRRALPDVTSKLPDVAESYVAPRTVVEEEVAKIWADILGVDQIGIYDNFFALGGHSLHLIQIRSRLQQTFQIELSMQSLVEIRNVIDLTHLLARQEAEPGQIERVAQIVKRIREMSDQEKRALLQEKRQGRDRVDTVNASNATGFSSEDLELLAYLLDEEGIERHQRPAITPQPRHDSLPLSFAQEQMWLLDQLDPGNSVYIVPFAFRLTGVLQVSALEQSLNEIVRRHEILRTTFPAREGRVVQLISSPSPMPLKRVNFEHIPDAEQEARVTQYVQEEMQRPFDFAHGPLLRANLIRLHEQDHIFVIIAHHIISDAWSLGIFVHEIVTLYPAFSRMESLPLPPLPLQYADYAIWQRSWWQGDVRQAELTYWKEQLAGAPPVLMLPTDHSRPAVQTSHGATSSFTLPLALLNALRTLSQQEGVTMFMTLLAAFQALLFRYTGQDDIVIGSPISNRDLVEIEPLIGVFINTLVFRTSLAGNPTFQQLLHRVKKVASGAYAHQHMPFEQLVEELEVERDPGRTPLIQAMFVHQSAPFESFTLPELVLHPFTVNSGTAKFDLTLYLEESTQGLNGSVEYNTDLFEATTITRLISHLSTLLTNIVATPQRQISDLSVLTQAELHQMLREWNNTGETHSGGTVIHELFERQVERTPHALAVTFGDDQLTYLELNQRANQLAHYLQRLGVGPEVLVGICMSRSLDLMVSILGVLKAGGAYVPLDLAYPSERLTFMLEHSQAAVLLTQQQIEKFSVPGLRMICLNDIQDKLARESENNPVSGVMAGNLAYVIYTSGSTGKPKGTMIPHGGLVNYLTWCVATYDVAQGQGAPVHSSIGFDLTITSLFSPLIAGKSVVLLSEEPGGEALRRALCARKDFSLVKVTPAHLEILTQQLSVEQAQESTRALIIGGEALHGEDLVFWQNDLPDVRLINEYGPTETVVGCCVYEVSARVRISGAVPIGRPIANTQIYLFDQYLQPVPIGVYGELYIGGAGVARGYLNAPDLTADRFIPHPFGDVAGARLYRTGDLACYRPDGNIEFLGRIDHQVKLRGFRIELDEIEAVLSQHPDLVGAVAVVREDRPDDKRLVAYVAVRQGATPSVDGLRQFLAERLPDYMLPSTFVLLDTFPLTSHGKVDRVALPLPDGARPVLENEFILPRTSIEQALVGIWKEILGVDQVGVNDNFFSLGGDSILCIQIAAHAAQAGLYFNPRQLFQYPTIATLSEVVTTTPQNNGAEQGLVTGQVPLTPVQIWFFEQNLSVPDHWNQSVLLQVLQPLETDLLEQAVAYLLEHHDALRMRFTHTPSGWQAMINGLDKKTIPFSSVDLADCPEEKQREELERIATEVQGSLNLLYGPLLRVVLIKFASGQPSRLLIVIHHLVIDGLSWRILLEDLHTAYIRLAHGDAVQLPPKTTSFKAWAEKLEAYAQTSIPDAEKTYWLDTRYQKAMPLPVDNQAGRNITATAHTISLILDAEETNALLHKIPQKSHGIQIDIVLLTALLQGFAQWTGQQALLIDLEGHGREEILSGVDLSRAVGWFTTHFPICFEMVKGQSPQEQLQMVKEVLQSIPNRGIGYGLLRYLHQDERVLSQLKAYPQPQICFNYLGQFDHILPSSPLFQLAQEYSGETQHHASSRPYLFEMNASIIGGQLRCDWTYSTEIYQQETVTQLTSAFLTALRALIDLCLTNSGDYTPADFPAARLGQKELNKFLSKLSKRG